MLGVAGGTLVAEKSSLTPYMLDQSYTGVLQQQIVGISPDNICIVLCNLELAMGVDDVAD